MPQRKASRITKRNKLNLRYKRAEESFRHIKQIMRKWKLINKDPKLSDTEKAAEVLKLDEKYETHAQEIRRCGLHI